MPARLPALHDLIAFDAAARHMSFLKASEELAITQSAVSHRIKSLEELLGVALFIRVNRNIALTTFGETYLAQVRDILARLASATGALAPARRRRLNVSAAPALGARWLVARLAGFQRAHPDVDLAVSSSYDLEVIRRGEVDVGIRYGAEDAPGLATHKLFQETLFPVASPAYLAGLGTLADPADLERATLLRHPQLSWQSWFGAAGVAPEPAPRGPLYEDAMLMYEAAIAGQGVALILATLYHSYRVAGSLVKPFDLEVPDKAYTVVHANAAAPAETVRQFVDWLLAQAR